MIYCLRPLLSINNNISRECRSRGLYCSTWKLYSPCFRPREIHWYIIYYSYHNDVSCQLQVQLIPIPHSKEDDFFAIVSPPLLKFGHLRKDPTYIEPGVLSVQAWKLILYKAWIFMSKESSLYWLVLVVTQFRRRLNRKKKDKGWMTKNK